MPIGKSVVSLPAIVATIVALLVGVGGADWVRPYLPELADIIGFVAGILAWFIVIWMFPGGD